MSKDDKEINLGKLRKKYEAELEEKSKALEKANKQAEEAQTKLEEQAKANKRAKVSRAVGQFTDDEDVRDQIVEEFHNFKGEPENDEQFNLRIKKSFRVVTGSDPGEKGIGSDVKANIIGSDPSPKNRKTGKLSQEAKKFAKENLDVTDEELKESNLL